MQRFLKARGNFESPLCDTNTPYILIPCSFEGCSDILSCIISCKRQATPTPQLPFTVATFPYIHRIFHGNTGLRDMDKKRKVISSRICKNESRTMHRNQHIYGKNPKIEIEKILKVVVFPYQKFPQSH